MYIKALPRANFSINCQPIILNSENRVIISNVFNPAQIGIQICLNADVVYKGVEGLAFKVIAEHTSWIGFEKNHYKKEKEREREREETIVC